MPLLARLENRLNHKFTLNIWHRLLRLHCQIHAYSLSDELFLSLLWRGYALGRRRQIRHGSGSGQTFVELFEPFVGNFMLAQSLGSAAPHKVTWRARLLVCSYYFTKAFLLQVLIKELPVL